MNPDKIAQEIVEEVTASLDGMNGLNEGSKEMLDANVAAKKRTDHDDMPSIEGHDEDGGENAGSDSKAKLTSSTNKYKGGSVNEMEQSEMEGETAPDHDENEGKRDPRLAPKRGAVEGEETSINEMEEEGDEEEPTDEYGEDAIKKKIEEHLSSEVMSAAIQEHLSAMFSSEDASLNEEFTAKTATIFEAAISERVRSTIDIIVEENTRVITTRMDALNEAAEELNEEVVNQIDTYLTMVAEEWMNENELQVESGLRTEISEEFISGLKGLFESHNIEIPQEKYDVIVDMNEEIDTLKEQLNNALESNAENSKQLREASREQILTDASKDLTLTESEKLKNLSEGLSIDSVEDFEGEVKTLKEAYFTPNGDDTSSETAVKLHEDGDTSTGDPSMDNLVENMGHFGKSEE